MYKNDKQIIEDAFFPSILEALMQSHVKQKPERIEYYRDAIKLLQEDIAAEVKSKKILKRVSRLEKSVMYYFDDNGWVIPKAYMILSRLAIALWNVYDEDGEHTPAVMLRDNTQQVIKEIDETVDKFYDDERIVNQDKSAAKQMPKLLKFIQEQGYFI